eukprot:Rhum_TRINITY_DN14794_c0_g1::Rhum_TRINITY_DN14794_c0_g1_i4::g.116537::m.116537
MNGVASCGDIQERGDGDPTRTIATLRSALAERDSTIAALESSLEAQGLEVERLQDELTALTAPHPPDSTHGWLITLCAFTVQFTVLGGVNCFGVFIKDLEKDASLGLPSASRASIVVSVANGLNPVVGLFAGRLTDRWGPRPLLMLSGLMLGTGFLTASYTENFYLLLLTFGVVMGVASGTCISPGLAAVGEWFSAKRSLAFGVVYAGSGLGTTVCPLLAHFLLKNFGWRVSFRYMAILGVPAVLAGLATRKRVPYKPPCETSSHLKIKQILTNRIVVVLFFVGLFFAYGFFVVVVYTYTYAKTFGSKKPYEHRSAINDTQATLLLSIFGLTQTVGNIVWGGACKRWGNLHTFKVAHLMCGALMAVWPFCAWYWSLLVFSGLMGFFIAGCLTCYPALAADHFAGPQLGTILAVIYLGFGAGSLVGPPLTGVLIDVSGGNYLAACLVSTALYAAATLLVHLCVPPVPAQADECGALLEGSPQHAISSGDEASDVVTTRQDASSQRAIGSNVFVGFARPAQKATQANERLEQPLLTECIRGA